jgi:hypothetical protein
LLGNGYERNRPGVKGFNQLGEVGKRASEAIDLVDDHHIDLAGFNIYQQLFFEGGAVEVAAGIRRIVVVLRQHLPAQRRLALDIGLAGISLCIQRIELLLQSMFGGFAGIDGAVQKLGITCHRRPLSSGGRKNAARSIWCQ